MKKKLLLGLVVGATMGATITTPAIIHNNDNGLKVNKMLFTNSIESSKTNEAVVINGNSSLNLYGLSNGKGIISNLSMGEMLTILNYQNGYCRVKVQETGRVGYINVANMQRIVNGINDSFNPLLKSGSIINVSTSVRVRQNPSINSKIMSNLSNGTKLSILGKQGQWYEVKVDGNKGFIYEKYIMTDAENSLLNNNKNATININANNTVKEDKISSSSFNSVKSNTENLILKSKNNNIESLNSSKENLLKKFKLSNTSNNPVISNGDSLFLYYGYWVPNKKISINKEIAKESNLTTKELNEKKFIFTRKLYSYNGITIKNPKYYMVSYPTKEFFSNKNFKSYSGIDNFGSYISFVVAVPQENTFNTSLLNIYKAPFYTNGGLFAFEGPQNQIYRFENCDPKVNKNIGEPIQTQWFKLSTKIVNLEGDEKLPLYSKSIKSSKVIEKLSNGDKINAVKLYSNGWNEIKVGNTSGFVWGPYIERTTVLQINGNDLNEPANFNTPRLNVTGIVSSLSKGYILDLMSEPSSNGETIGGFDNGKKVTIIKNLNNGWLQVKYRGNIGYVVGKYIKY